MMEEWIREVADKYGKRYAERETDKDGNWKRGDVVIENQMSYSDGFADGWAMAQEYLRRICVDYKTDAESGYFATIIYGLFTNQSNFKGIEDAFPKTTELIKRLEDGIKD